MKPWKIEIRPDKHGGLLIRMVADVHDRIAEEVAKRIERVLSHKCTKA